MLMPSQLLDRPIDPLPLPDRASTSEPVTLDGPAIRLRPNLMELGRFYVVTLRGEPYLYRKVSESEIEVYGLAE